MLWKNEIFTHCLFNIGCISRLDAFIKGKTSKNRYMPDRHRTNNQLPCRLGVEFLSYKSHSGITQSNGEGDEGLVK